MRKLNFKAKTTLKNIEDYRLEELIFKDIENYPNSAFGDIHQRIGHEINKHKIRRVLKIWLIINVFIVQVNEDGENMLLSKIC